MRVALVMFGLAWLATAGRIGNPSHAAEKPIVVGSKNFTESYLLAEMMAQLLEEGGFKVQRRLGLGGTLIAFEALHNGGIDLYAEYSGTLELAILKLAVRPSYPLLQRLIREKYGMELLEPFGLNNAYALTMTRTEAERRGIKTISDLSKHPDLRYGFSHDFLERPDGWPGLVRVYGLEAKPSAVEHGLSYPAVGEGKIHVTDAYTTDGDILKFDMVILQDDKKAFPLYLAAPIMRGGLDPRVRQLLTPLVGKIADDEMQALNARASQNSGQFGKIASEFLRSKGLLQATATRVESTFWTRLWPRVRRHLYLTGCGLAAGMVIAIPLGILIYRRPRIARPVIYLCGVLQTLPSIALLAFMVPLLGIGEKPAIAALFLYALLPILRNTALALFTIDPVIKKVSVGMGLTPWQRLRHVELPLAAPTILAGIKTAAVINIGTATLAAYIGAGGLGDPIVTGLALNDRTLILEGAIPAAVLAILTELAFELLEKVMVPRHLLQKPVE